jgi:hypothetical protein
MPEAEKLTPAGPSDLAAALAYARRYQGRKRVHSADELMSDIVAKRLVEHLERAGFAVIPCRVCPRQGSYRLARLAAKFGPEISLRELIDRFSYDCLWRAEARSKRGQSAYGVYLPDLEQKRPPDGPPGIVKLRLVKKE